MIELDFKLKSKQARDKFQRLAKKLGDLRPIWKMFIPEYRKLVETEFKSTKGKIMQGKRWMKLTDAYRKRKRKVYGNQPLLVATGALRDAAINFDSKLKKHNLIMGVKGKDYMFHVHNRRAYFHTPDGDMPMRGWRILIDIANRELEK